MYDLRSMVLALPGILIALVFHEWAHARMAVAFGDDTPRNQGRLTLDPRAHLDWLGVLMLVLSGFRFGWAKPVMINPYRMQPRFWGELLTALAGILMNLLLAILFTVLLAATARAFPGSRGRELFAALEWAGVINLWLAIFNFLPVPPLDGWRVAVRVIPGFYNSRVARFLDQFGMFFLLLLIVLPFGKSILLLLLQPIAFVMTHIVAGVAGPIIALLPR